MRVASISSRPAPPSSLMRYGNGAERGELRQRIARSYLKLSDGPAQPVAPAVDAAGVEAGGEHGPEPPVADPAEVDVLIARP